PFPAPLAGGHTGKSSNARHGERNRKGPELRSWTQPDLDDAIRSYKAARAVIYYELVQAIGHRGRGAKQTAQRQFGRNAIARALGVRSRAMVTKSPVWQEMARELRLSHKHEDRRPAGRLRRVGFERAQEDQAEEVGDTVQEEVDRRETVRLVRANMSK